jgi:hypothetical protein
MDPTQLAELINASVKAALLDQLPARTSARQHEPKTSATDRCFVNIPPESNVQLIEGNRLVNGKVISINASGWVQIIINGTTTLFRRAGQLLIDAATPNASNMTAGTPTLPANGNPASTVPSVNTATFSWLYVPLIATAEGLSNGANPRPTCFNVESAKLRVGGQLFNECAQLLSNTMKDKRVQWEGTYIPAIFQEELIASVSNVPQFQQMLLNASQFTRTPIRRPRSEAAATPTPTRRAGSSSTNVRVGVTFNDAEEGEEIF